MTVAQLRSGSEPINLVILVEYQQGGEKILDECYTRLGEDSIYAVAQDLIDFGRKLEKRAEKEIEATR